MYEYENKNSLEMSADDEDDEHTDRNTNKNDESISNTSDLSDNEMEAPGNYIFSRYMAFVTWGPFVEPKDRLLLCITSDASKNDALGRTTTRKAKVELNNADRASDYGNMRDFSTDQRISIEGLHLQKKVRSNI